MSTTRRRDYEAERNERESFILLQHLYTVSDGQPSVSLPDLAVGQQLGFARQEISRLLDHLAELGYVRRTASSGLTSLTLEGADYIERLAWRRHSARALSEPRA